MILRESDRKFFKPLWRRVVIVAFCSAWAAWEWFNGAAFWGMLVTGIALYALWAFIITFNENDEAE